MCKPSHESETVFYISFLCTILIKYVIFIIQLK
jgi:hypothetical protein